jgi:ankyrin repeat protein
VQSKLRLFVTGAIMNYWDDDVYKAAVGALITGQPGTGAGAGANPEFLRAAVSNEDVATVQKLLQAKVSANTCHSYNKPVLEIAAQNGSESIAQLLVQHNADVGGNAGNEALHLAARRGNVGAVRLMLQAKAHVDRRDRESSLSPLQNAVAGRHCAVVDVLLAGNACVDSLAPCDSVAPLVIAACLGETGAAVSLLDAKADVRGITDVSGRPRNCCSELLEDLLKKGTVPVESVTALCAAASNGHVDVARILLEAKADVEDWGQIPIRPFIGTTSVGLTPLMRAARHVEMTRLLLQWKADVNRAATSDGKTAVHYAVKAQAVSVLQLLLEAKACTHTADKYGRTPLHEPMCTESSVRIVGTLLRAKAPVDAKCHKGLTPLHMAAAAGQSLVVRMLLAAKASVANAPAAVAAAAMHGHTLSLAVLLQAKADANYPMDGKTPLYFAAANGLAGPVGCLLAAGADVHVGMSPLRAAVDAGHVHLARIFIECDGRFASEAATSHWFVGSNYQVLCCKNGDAATAQEYVKAHQDFAEFVLGDEQDGARVSPEAPEQAGEDGAVIKRNRAAQ